MNEEKHEQIDPVFLGRGWAFPMHLDRQGHAAFVSENDDIRQAIRIILGTSPGERVMRPEFGASLNELVFEPINVATQELTRLRVESALQRWEPRIDVLSVDVTIAQGGRNGVLNIEINYRVRETNTEENLVYPFYLQEVHR